MLLYKGLLLCKSLIVSGGGVAVTHTEDCWISSWIFMYPLLVRSISSNSPGSQVLIQPQNVLLIYSLITLSLMCWGKYLIFCGFQHCLAPFSTDENEFSFKNITGFQLSGSMAECWNANPSDASLFTAVSLPFLAKNSNECISYGGIIKSSGNKKGAVGYGTNALLTSRVYHVWHP